MILMLLASPDNLSRICIWRDKTATGAQLNGQRAENGGQVSLAA
jgi:hypothetical protein